MRRDRTPRASSASGAVPRSGVGGGRARGAGAAVAAGAAAVALVVAGAPRLARGDGGGAGGAAAGVASDGNDLEVEALATLPLRGWADRVGAGLGAGARLRVPLGDDATITARFSGVWHLPADVDAGGLTAEAHLLEWPLVGGVRYHVSDPGAVRGYFFGEVGVVLRRTDLVVAGLHDSDFDIAFAAALGAGVELGRVDVHVSAWLADLDRLDDSIGVTVAVGLHALAL